MTPAPWRSIIREPALAAAAVAILLLFWWPLTGETFYFRDLYSHFYPERHYVAETLRAGELPLWDCCVGGGRPLLANPNNVALYPSTLLYLVIDPLTAFNLDIVLHFVLIAVAMYFLARRVGLSSAGAFVAAVAAAASGPTLSVGNLLNHLYALLWSVVALLAWNESRDSNRWLAATAVAVAIQITAGAPEITLLTLLLLLAWRPSWRWLTMAILAAVLAAVQIVPAIDLVAQTRRGGGISFGSSTFWSLSPRRLPELVLPKLFGDLSVIGGDVFRGGNIEDKRAPFLASIYFGLPLLIAAIAGAAAGAFSRRMRWLLALTPILLMLIALGRFFPLAHLLWLAVPPLRALRFPSKALELAPLAIALLAGAGIERIADQMRRWLGVRAVALLLVLTAAYFLLPSPFDQLVFRMQLSPAQHHAVLRVLLYAVAVTFVFTLIPLVRTKLATAAVAVVIAVDLLLSGVWVNPTAPRSLFDEPALARIVRRENAGGRFYRGDAGPEMLASPTPDRYWQARWEIETLSRTTGTLFDIPVMFHNDPDLFNRPDVNQLTTAVKTASDWPQRLRLMTSAGVTLFLWPADRIAGAHPIGAVANQATRLYLWRNDALPSVPRIVSINRRGTWRIRTVAEHNHQAVYDAQISTDGYIVLNIPFYRGWSASVDGVPAPIIEGAGGTSALLLRPGNHRIALRYAPRAWTGGVALSALGLIAIAIWLIAGVISAHNPRRETEDVS